jgi:5-formyltetrahydrofolate cyclo-ligase
LTEAERARASRSISAHAGVVVRSLSPPVVAAYLPIRSECDPRPLIEAARAWGASIALPATSDGGPMVFRLYEPGGPLVAGSFGTLVPPPTAPAIDPDLIVLPVVAFDRTGVRLGYGRGFYDRAIAAMTADAHRPVLLGIAFAVQEVDHIPREPHDVSLDWIVTETETIGFK